MRPSRQVPTLYSEFAFGSILKQSFEDMSGHRLTPSSTTSDFASHPQVFRILERCDDVPAVEYATAAFGLIRHGKAKPCALIATRYYVYVAKVDGSALKLYCRWPIEAVTFRPDREDDSCIEVTYDPDPFGDGTYCVAEAYIAQEGGEGEQGESASLLPWTDVTLRALSGASGDAVRDATRRIDTLKNDLFEARQALALPVLDPEVTTDEEEGARLDCAARAIAGQGDESAGDSEDDSLERRQRHRPKKRGGTRRGRKTAEKAGKQLGVTSSGTLTQLLSFISSAGTNGDVAMVRELILNYRRTSDGHDDGRSVASRELLQDLRRYVLESEHAVEDVFANNYERFLSFVENTYGLLPKDVTDVQASSDIAANAIDHASGSLRDAAVKVTGQATVVQRLQQADAVLQRALPAVRMLERVETLVAARQVAAAAEALDGFMKVAAPVAYDGKLGEYMFSIRVPLLREQLVKLAASQLHQWLASLHPAAKELGAELLRRAGEGGFGRSSEFDAHARRRIVDYAGAGADLWAVRTDPLPVDLSDVERTFALLSGRLQADMGLLEAKASDGAAAQLTTDTGGVSETAGPRASRFAVSRGSRQIPSAAQAAKGSPPPLPPSSANNQISNAIGVSGDRRWAQEEARVVQGEALRQIFAILGEEEMFYSKLEDSRRRHLQQLLDEILGPTRARQAAAQEDGLRATLDVMRQAVKEDESRKKGEDSASASASAPRRGDEPHESDMYSSAVFSSHCAIALGYLRCEDLLRHLCGAVPLRSEASLLRTWETLQVAIADRATEIRVRNPPSAPTMFRLLSRFRAAVVGQLHDVIGGTSLLDTARSQLRDSMQSGMMVTVTNTLQQLLMLDELAPLGVTTAADFKAQVLSLNLQRAPALLAVPPVYRGNVTLPFSGVVGGVGHLVLGFVNECFSLGYNQGADGGVVGAISNEASMSQGGRVFDPVTGVVVEIVGTSIDRDGGAGDANVLRYLDVIFRSVSSTVRAKAQMAAMDAGPPNAAASNDAVSGKPDNLFGPLAVLYGNIVAFQLLCSTVEQRYALLWGGHLAGVQTYGTPVLLADAAKDLVRTGDFIVDQCARALLDRIDAALAEGNTAGIWLRIAQAAGVEVPRIKAQPAAISATPTDATPVTKKESRFSIGRILGGVTGSGTGAATNGDSDKPKTADAPTATAPPPSFTGTPIHNACAQLVSAVNALKGVWPSELLRGQTKAAVYHFAEHLRDTILAMVRTTEVREMDRARRALWVVEGSVRHAISDMIPKIREGLPSQKFPLDLASLFADATRAAEEAELRFAEEMANKLRVQAELEEAAFAAVKGVKDIGKFAQRGVVTAASAVARGVTLGAIGGRTPTTTQSPASQVMHADPAAEESVFAKV